MLDYGFAGYRRVVLINKDDLLGKTVPVHLGMAEEVEAAVGSGVSMLLKAGQEKQLSLEVELPPQLEAPVEQGQTIGMVRVLLNGQVIAKVPAVAAQAVGMPGLIEGFLRVLGNWR
jgi:D-alanyl-D-alanine carboxypeptidase (penicillin-binding protein 5/6)